MRHNIVNQNLISTLSIPKLLFIFADNFIKSKIFFSYQLLTLSTK